MTERSNDQDLGRRYFHEVTGLMEKTYKTELPKIQRAIELAADTILAGKKCYCRYSMGHMIPDEIGDQRVGGPQIFITTGTETIETGDFLLTSAAGEDILKIKEMGVTVVGIQNPWVLFEGAPREKVNAAPDTPSIEDVSEFVINTYTPYDEGILNIPEIDSAFLPTGNPTFMHIYWMVCSGVAEKLVQGGEVPRVITS